MTQRTKSTLQTNISADLASNTTGEISAQDIRDIVTDITDSTEMGVVTITEDYTAAGYTTILVNNSAADATVTLPTASSASERIYNIKKIHSSASYKVIIDGDGSETIDGSTTYNLYLQYESVKIQSDGSNWHILEKNLTPFLAKITRDAAQTISHDTITVVSYDNAVFDNGSISDTSSNYRVTIKRAGKYEITVYNSLTNYEQKYLASGAKLNGSTVQKYHFDYSSSSVGRPMSTLNITLDLSSGDYIEGLVYHNSGVTKSTNTSLHYKPEFTIKEII
tara:strand:- start:655 stop:1491 length:837 start_codon:yes stop_codon:yes gene_type:complete